MSSLRVNVIANYVGRAWPALLSILLIPVYIKFLGIEAYGLVGFYATLSAVMGIFDLGIGSTMNRELAKRSVNKNGVNSQRDLVKTLEIIYWIITILVGLIVILSAEFISGSWVKAESIDSPTITKAVQLMGLSIALRFPMSLYQGGLMGIQKQVLVNKLLIYFGTIRGLGTVLVLWGISPTITVFFGWQAFMSLLGSLVFFNALWFSLPKSITKARFNSSILGEIWKYAGAVSINALIGMVLSQLDKIILSKMLELKMFAYYSIAATVASAIWMFILPFNNAVFPKLVQLFEEKVENKLITFFHQTSQFLSTIILPVGFTLILFSEEILFLWLKDPLIVKNSHLILSFLVIGTIMNGLASLPANSSNAFGWPMLTTYTNMAQTVFIIPLIIYLVSSFSAIGASIAWMIMNSIYLFIMSPIFFSRYLKSEKNKWFLFDIGIPTIVALCTSLLSKLLFINCCSINNSVIWILFTVPITFLLTGLSVVEVRSSLIFKINLLKKICIKP